MQKDDERDDFQARPAQRVIGHVDGWEDLAIDYLDGQADPETQAAIDAHLAGCEACASRLGLQRSVCALFGQTPLQDAPTDLEDLVLGEVLFPNEKARAAAREPALQPSRWSMFWDRKFKPWVPAMVGVVAVLVAISAYGLVHGTTGSKVAKEAPQATTAAASESTAAERAAAGAGALNPAVTSTTAASPTTEAATETTVVALGAANPADGSTTYGPASTTASAPTFAYDTAMIQDRKQIITALKEASSPAYLVLEPATEATSGPSPDETAAEFARQLTQLTGLQPVDSSLAVRGTTFAAYLAKKQASQFVDLLCSIGSSLSLTLNLAWTPVGTALPQTMDTYADLLRRHEAEFPELHASRTPQPAVSDWTFTTSTLLPQDRVAAPPPDWEAPDEAGSDVLVVIYLGL